MFYEIIFTRCQWGIDIKNGAPLKPARGGDMVYAASPAIYKSGNYDLEFLHNVVRSNPPYDDPRDMSDAYLYCIDSKGNCFLMNSHPVHIDPNMEGNFDKRPGNRLNNAFLGDFSNIYPFELFEDDEFWEAKSKGVEYYYTVEPNELGSKDIADPPGQISIEEIQDFISDGRKDLLCKAVAFLIERYTAGSFSKTLRIKDASTKNLQLWIAAIEYAFSPKIASGVSFATRLNIGEYTFNTMITGVYSEDKKNSAFAKPSPQIVFIDGIEKTINYDADISSHYYNLISEYGDNHAYFVREFLQTFNIKKPLTDIIDLGSIFKFFDKENVPNEKILEIIIKLNEYGFTKTRFLSRFYAMVEKNLSELMMLDASNIPNIIVWLKKASEILDIQNNTEHINTIVKSVFEQSMLKKDNVKLALDLWNMAKQDSLINLLAPALYNMALSKGNASKIFELSSDEVIKFLSMYVEGSLLSDSINVEHVVQVIKVCAESICNGGDFEKIKSLINIVQDRLSGKIDTTKTLIYVASKSKEKTSDYLVNSMIELNLIKFTTSKELTEVCEGFNSLGMSRAIGALLDSYISKQCKISDVEQFLKWVSSTKFVSNEIVKMVFNAFDKKINIVNKAELPYAEFLIKNKPKNLMITRSVHLLALALINNTSNRNDFSSSLKNLKNYGFPSIDDKEYSRVFAKSLLNSDLDFEEINHIIDLFIDAPDIYLYEYIFAVTSSISSYKDEWCELLEYACKANSSKEQQTIRNNIIAVLSNNEQTKKDLKQLQKFVKGNKEKIFMDSIIEEILANDVGDKRKSSFIGSIFGKK